MSDTNEKPQPDDGRDTYLAPSPSGNPHPLTGLGFLDESDPFEAPIAMPVEWFARELSGSLLMESGAL